VENRDWERAKEWRNLGDCAAAGSLSLWSRFAGKTNKISNSTTKEATTLLLEVVASWVGPMQRSGCSFLPPGDANIGGIAAILPCQFHEKKNKWLLKTNKISNSMTKEATTLLFLG
jgi:hypothetical protein